MPENSIVLSDPVHGFTKVPKKIIQPLLGLPEVQRLRRISQLGMSFMVFPSAEHSRFSHALGAMGLLSQALESIEAKGVPIQEEEKLSALAAILLHDIGHGPLSHTLEGQLIPNISHEDLSIALIERIIAQIKRNKSQIKRIDSRIEKSLKMAIQMLKKEYKRRFFSDLISSQLDMDRLDYLCRDSHFTGVVEGNIGVGQILRTLCVHPKKGGPNSRLAIEPKGVYAVESMLIARRLMYWQVYLHKTVLAADFLLHSAIRRARNLILRRDSPVSQLTSPILRWFLSRSKEYNWDLKDGVLLDKFLSLDDSDIIFSLKQWSKCSDPILSDLSGRILNRNLLRCKFLKNKPDGDEESDWKKKVDLELQKDGISEEDAHEYYLAISQSSHATYKPGGEDIHVLCPDDNLIPLQEFSDAVSIRALPERDAKYYVCYPKPEEQKL